MGPRSEWQAEGGPVPGIGARLRLRVFLRSLCLQACWNHQRMQNLGLLGTMLPWLYRLERRADRDRRFCRR